jgi:hypothetical protein
MRLAPAALALLAFVALPASAAGQAQAREIVLTLPRPVAAGETAFVEIRVGPIGRGSIGVETASGQPLGTVAGFGNRLGQDAGTFTVPVPPNAIESGRLALRLAIRQADGSRRAPTPDEVRGVTLRIGGAAR